MDAFRKVSTRYVYESTERVSKCTYLFGVGVVTIMVCGVYIEVPLFRETSMHKL